MFVLPIIVLFSVLIIIFLFKYLIPFIVRKITVKSIAKKSVKMENNTESEPLNATQIYKRLKLFVFGLSVIQIVFIIAVLSIIISALIKTHGMVWSSYMLIAVIIGLALSLVFSLLRCFKKTEKYDIKFLKKIFNQYFNWMIILPMSILAVIIFSFLNLVLPVFIYDIMNAVLWLTLLYVILFVFCIVGVKTGKKLISLFYGEEALVDNKKAVERLSISRLLEMRKEETEKEEKIPLSERIKSTCGSAVAGIKARKPLVIKICCAFLAYLVVFIISLFMFARSSDIFRTPFAMAITDLTSAELYLGEPLRKTEDNTNNYYVYEYYSGEYGKIVKKIESLTKAAENVDSFDKLFQLMEEQAKLEAKLENLEYKQIRVVQTSNDFSIYLNTAGGKTASGNKWDANGRIELGCQGFFYSSLGYSGRDFSIINCENLSEQRSGNILARIYYNDGSYAYYPLTYKFEDLQKGENELKWADGWGSYSVTINVTY